MTRGLWPLLALSLAGCARYAPLPLGSAESGAPAVAAVLVRDAAALRRPFLAPVAIDLARPLDADAVAALAVVGNPDLKAQRVRAGATAAQAFAARLLPDPTFSIGASKVVTGPDPLLDLASTLGFDLQALRTRGVRVAQVRAQERQIRLDLAWAEWQTARTRRSSTFGTPCDNGKYGSTRRICASDNQIRPLMIASPWRHH